MNYAGKHKKKDGTNIEVETVAQTILYDSRQARIAIVTDVTEKKRAQEQLLHDAFHDALTGLPNRNLFLNHLEFAVARTLVYPENKSAVLFVDFDRFKVICDSFGYSAGDMLLKTTARRLETSVRSGDLIARFGGSSFTVMLTGISDPAEALAEAERLSKLVKTSFELDGQQIAISASIGISVSEKHAGRAEDLIRDAAIAADDVRSQGRGLCQVFDPARTATHQASFASKWK